MKDDDVMSFVKAELALRLAEKRDAMRYRMFRSGIALNVTVPVVRDGKVKPVHVSFAPHQWPEFGAALDAALDAEIAKQEDSL